MAEACAANRWGKRAWNGGDDDDDVVIALTFCAVSFYSKGILGKRLGKGYKA